MLTIVKQISNYNHSSGNTKKYLVMHDTGNYIDTDEGNAHYFCEGDKQSSAHYFVDEDSITQVVEDDMASWHCGDGNMKYGIGNHNSIGIEMCNDFGSILEGTINNTLDLVVFLMKKYNIPIEKVVRHYDASRKNCPQNMNKDGNWSGWVAFKNQLSLSLGQPQSNIQAVVAAQNNIDSKIVQGKSYVGDRALELQQKLNKIMGMHIAEDGKFGGQSYGLLIAFQTKYNLIVDGKAGVATFSKLDELIAKGQSAPISQPKTKADVNPYVMSIQNLCNQLGLKDGQDRGLIVDGVYGTNTANAIAKLPVAQILGYRNKAYTCWIESRLGLKQDGIYFTGLSKAVKAFQTANKIGVDGKVGQETLKKMLGI